jgi:hypothetical protein
LPLGSFISATASTIVPSKPFTSPAAMLLELPAQQWMSR